MILFHAFLEQPASIFNPIPEFYGITLLDVNWYGMMCLLNLLFSTPVVVYSTSRNIFAYLGEFLEYGPPPPPAMDILMEAFAVQYTVHAMPGANNIIQLGAPPLIDWKSNTCKQEGKRTTNSHNLACLELKFMTSDLSDTLLEEPDLSIMSTNKVILPLLGGRAPAFEEAIEWLQFYFVGDHTGA